MAIRVTLTMPDLETWRAIQLAAAGAALRHARRCQDDTARRFELAAESLLAARPRRARR